MNRAIIFLICIPVLFSITSEGVAHVAKPSMVSREEWGSRSHPIPDSRKQIPVWITIHHAGVKWVANKQEPVQFVRDMQHWGHHRPKLEKFPPYNTYWPDLPYHFMIAPDGRIFQGRQVEYEPESNTRYFLNGNIGVEMMGDFDKQRPSIKQIRSCVALVAWLCKTYHIRLDHIRGHMEAAPDQTPCPGKDFNRYLMDGQFKKWVSDVLHGNTPKIKLGPPLLNGPSQSIPE